jgi:3-hydroxyisobutyrate dehydrogenase-like beta-hydroxyacid dehydrogenase
MQRPLRLGFLGFGEAAERLARDLARAGLTGMVAYSRSGAAAAPGDPLAERAREAGVHLVGTPRALCDGADVIIALTSGRAALSGLRTLRAHLGPHHFYVDANAASARAMEQAAALLEGRAQFIDAALMGAVPLLGIRVPVFISGERAAELQTLLAPLGLNLRVVSTRPGAASALKLIRSIAFKGLAGVLLESLEAAHRYGMLDLVARDIAGSFDGQSFMHNMKRYVCGTAAHAERRVHEMDDALELLESLGASTRMSRATRGMLKDVVKLGLPAHFNHTEPESMALVMDAIVEAKK